MMVQETYITNIPWMPELPSHWKIIRGKNLFIEKSIKNYPNEPLLAASQKQGVVLKKMLEQRSMEAISNFESFKLVEKDDFVISLRSFEGGLEIAHYRGIISPVYNIFNFRENDYQCEKNYFKHLFKSIMFIQELNIFKKGIRDGQSISYKEFANILFPLPPIEEQIAIANHLDSQSKKIKHFIKKKQTFIKLLKEQRQAVINKAVTKGINSNVTLKDSGIDWLGDIPEHWEVIKINGLCDFVRGNSSFKKDELLNKGKYVALQYGKTYKVDEVDEHFQFYVNEEFYKPTQTIKFGDIIVVSTSETIEDLGHSVFYNRNDIGLLGGEQMALKPYHQNIDNKYLYYSAKLFTKTLQIYATGVKVFRFNINHLKTIYTSLPPKEEQIQIVTYIKTETAKIDQAIAKAQKEIELIKEYKEAMIAEAVLGKYNYKIVKS